MCKQELGGEMKTTAKTKIYMKKWRKRNKEKRKIYMKEWHQKKEKKYNGLYAIWESMKRRCYTPSQTDYKYWGGRGITVCDEWINNFLSFYNWAINNRYKKGLQIDRIDNDGNYSPENCRFVTPRVNTRNSRGPKLTIEDVKGIKRKLLLGISNRKVAEDYPVVESQISNIKRGLSWTDIKAF